MHRVWARKEDNDDQFESVYHFNPFILLKVLYLFDACCSGVNMFDSPCNRLFTGPNYARQLFLNHSAVKNHK